MPRCCFFLLSSVLKWLHKNHQFWCFLKNDMIWQLLKYDLKIFSHLTERRKKKWIFLPTHHVSYYPQNSTMKYILSSFTDEEIEALRVRNAAYFLSSSLSWHTLILHSLFVTPGSWVLWTAMANGSHRQGIGVWEGREIGLFIFCFLLLCTLSLAVASPVPNPTIAVFPPQVPLAYGWIMSFCGYQVLAASTKEVTITF